MNFLPRSVFSPSALTPGAKLQRCLRQASSIFLRAAGGSISDPADWHDKNNSAPDEVLLNTQQLASNYSTKNNFLTFGPHALPPEFQNRTVVLPFRNDAWWEKALRSLHLSGIAQRSRAFRQAWAFFCHAPNYTAVVTTGTLDGLTFAFLQKLRGHRRPAHIMYDCLWYGGTKLKRAWMRSCLRQVDRCIVWASVERKRYAATYQVSPDKFVFVPHHHSLLRYTFEISDEGYLFTGGNADRDYGFFFEAVRDLPIRCLVATNRPNLLSGLKVPKNVRLVSATPSEFRQLIARARVVVMPMRATLLHAGAQQTILNAMYMGKPVILTDPEGGADYIEHGKTGLLVPYGDVCSLRESTMYLWEHPQEAQAMGERAREVAAPLTTERCNTEIWELAEHLLPSNPDCREANIA
jgi:glycosyltransferase involved in cell wall biosynthesis